MIIFFPNLSFGYDQKDLDKLKKYNSCIHCDLAGANLYGMNLVSANLSSANLSYANLSCANLSGANLSGANLSDANLNLTNLTNTDLSGVNFRGASISYTKLKGANFANADLENSYLEGTNFKGVNLCGANLKQTKGLSSIKKQSIEDMALICTQVDKNNGDYVDKNDKIDKQKRREKLATLEASNGCPKCDLSEINLENADLSGMYFFSTKLSKANLKGANLKGAFLNYSILKGANLENANLENANLVGSNLENIYLCGANIKGIKGINPDKKQSIEDLTRICTKVSEKTQVSEKNDDYVDNEVEDLRRNIKAVLVDHSYISSKKKALMLNELYNTFRQDKYLISMLKIDLTNLFSKYLELPFFKVSDFLNTSFDGMPLNEAAINKLILSLPNSSILTFRYLIQDNKQFTIDARQRRKVIKDIDKIILKKINLQMIAYGSEKDADGKAKAINILNTPLTVATNIDTNIEFEGKFRIPTGMNSTEFNELFSWSYDNKKAKPIISGKNIKWIEAYKIRKKDLASNYDTRLKKIFTISFGDFQKIVKFNINRKLYYPIVKGTGFNLIELDYPTLSECIKALNNGVKLPNDDIFYDKGIYKFEINKFSWTDQREYFTCERYGISDEDTEFYTKSNMLP